MALYRTGLYVKNHSVEKVQVAKTPIASYNGNVTGLYIPELIAYITAKQSGSGTPSPDNIRQISGVSSVNLCNTPMPVSQLWNIDSSFNGVVNFNQLIKTKTTQTYQIDGLTITFDGNGKVIVEGNATSNTQIPITSNYPTYYVGHRYLIMGCPSGGSNSTYSLRYNSNGFGENGRGAILTAVSSGAASNAILVGSNFPAISITTGTTLNKTFEPIIIDLTQMFGSTIADYIHSLERATAGAGVAFFRSIYPNDYYAYDIGTDEMVGSREGNTYTIQLGDTYYGCHINATTGLLTVYRQFAIFDGTENWVNVGGQYPYAFQIDTYIPNIKSSPITLQNIICNMFAQTNVEVPTNNAIRWQLNTQTGRLYVYCHQHSGDLAGFKQMLSENNLQVCYVLATPITVQLTPTQIEQLLGVNNVFADCGDVEVKFYNVIR